MNRAGEDTQSSSPRGNRSPYVGADGCTYFSTPGTGSGTSYAGATAHPTSGGYGGGYSSVSYNGCVYYGAGGNGHVGHEAGGYIGGGYEAGGYGCGGFDNNGNSYQAGGYDSRYDAHVRPWGRDPAFSASAGNLSGSGWTEAGGHGGGGFNHNGNRHLAGGHRSHYDAHVRPWSRDPEFCASAGNFSGSGWTASNDSGGAGGRGGLEEARTVQARTNTTLNVASERMRSVGSAGDGIIGGGSIGRGSSQERSEESGGIWRAWWAEGQKIFGTATDMSAGKYKDPFWVCTTCGAPVYEFERHKPCLFCHAKCFENLNSRSEPPLRADSQCKDCKHYTFFERESCRVCTSVITVPRGLKKVLRRNQAPLVVPMAASAAQAGREFAAARRLQGLARGHLARSSRRRQGQASRVLQAFSRRLAARAQAAELRAAIAQARRESAAAARLQGLARGYLARSSRRRHGQAARVLQAFGRRLAARAQAAELRAAVAQARRESAAAARLQGLARGYLARSSRRRHGQAAQVLQAFSRRLAARAQAAELRAAVNLLQRWGRGTLQARRYRRVLRAVTGAQARVRGMAVRRQVAVRTRAARPRRLWYGIGGLMAVVAAIVVAVCLLFGGPSPCLRGNIIRSGDEPVVPGTCIEGATGSRLFGWVPGVSWKPRLSVTADGNMVARRPSGSTVKLTGHIPEGDRSGGLLCGAERLSRKLSGRGEPAYGVRQAHGKLTLGREHLCSIYRTPAPKGMGAGLTTWLERGGRLGFSEDGDLEVIGAKGNVLWSLASELVAGGDNRGGVRWGYIARGE